MNEKEEELYMQFCQIRKHQLLQSYPQLQTEEVAKIIALDWSKLTPDQRRQFVVEFSRANQQPSPASTQISPSYHTESL